MESLFWIVLAVVAIFSTTTVAENATNSTTSCPADCDVVIPFAEVYLWIADQYWLAFEVQSTVITATSTVVTVINTALDATRTSTIYPDGFTAPVNADGTRVETITYTRSSKASTTVVTYPTPFIVWPESYGWHGTMNTTQGGQTQCVTATTDSTALPILTSFKPGFGYGAHYESTTLISTNPQPTGGRLYAEDAEDTTGSQYRLYPAGMDSTLLQSDPGLRDLFPNDPAIEQCRPGGSGPNLAPFTATSWTQLGTIIYEDSTPQPGPTSTSPTSINQQPIQTDVDTPKTSPGSDLSEIQSTSSSTRTSPTSSAAAATSVNSSGEHTDGLNIQNDGGSGGNGGKGGDGGDVRDGGDDTGSHTSVTKLTSLTSGVTVTASANPSGKSKDGSTTRHGGDDDSGSPPGTSTGAFFITSDATAAATTASSGGTTNESSMQNGGGNASGSHSTAPGRASATTDATAVTSARPSGESADGSNTQDGGSSSSGNPTNTQLSAGDCLRPALYWVGLMSVIACML